MEIPQQRKPFGSLEVHEDTIVLKIGPDTKIIPDGYFVRRNGRKAADQTSQELNELLRQQCYLYAKRSFGPKILRNITIEERYDMEKEMMVHEAYHEPCNETVSTSTKNLRSKF